MAPLLKLQSVSKCYVTGLTCEIFPINGISLDIAAGERIILLGKSGSGKSTFLNLVGGVDRPTTGSIFFNGTELSRLSQAELAQYRRTQVGFIFQSFNLFSTLTVGENLMLPLDLLGNAQETRARELLAAVGLSDKWEKFPEQLSGGEQQRVAIARALVKDPKIILADEPTGNLDMETGNGIINLIDEVCRNTGATLIMVTHSQEAAWLANRIFRLKGGKLIEEPV
jgi:putative ABC transport system ATP-binding protein